MSANRPSRDVVSFRRGRGKTWPGEAVLASIMLPRAPRPRLRELSERNTKPPLAGASRGRPYWFSLAQTAAPGQACVGIASEPRAQDHIASRRGASPLPDPWWFRTRVRKRPSRPVDAGTPASVRRAGVGRTRRDTDHDPRLHPGHRGGMDGCRLLEALGLAVGVDGNPGARGHEGRERRVDRVQDAQFPMRVGGDHPLDC